VKQVWNTEGLSNLVSHLPSIRSNMARNVEYEHLKFLINHPECISGRSVTVFQVEFRIVKILERSFLQLLPSSVAATSAIATTAEIVFKLVMGGVGSTFAFCCFRKVFVKTAQLAVFVKTGRRQQDVAFSYLRPVFIR
jgi:hypothetical protein